MISFVASLVLAFSRLISAYASFRYKYLTISEPRLWWENVGFVQVKNQKGPVWPFAKNLCFPRLWNEELVSDKFWWVTCTASSLTFQGLLLKTRGFSADREVLGPYVCTGPATSWLPSKMQEEEETAKYWRLR